MVLESEMFVHHYTYNFKKPIPITELPIELGSKSAVFLYENKISLVFLAFIQILFDNIHLFTSSSPLFIISVCWGIFWMWRGLTVCQIKQLIPKHIWLVNLFDRIRRRYWTRLHLNGSSTWCSDEKTCVNCSAARKPQGI